MRLRLLTAAALVATTAIVATSCTSSGSDPAGDAGADPVVGIETPATRPVSLLAASDDCGALLERIQDSVRPHVGPYGLLGYGPHPMAWAARTSGNFVLLGDVAATSAPKQATDLGHSTTNVQEAGIDEADVIETDGRRVLALVGSRLVYVDIDGPMRRRGAVDLKANDLDQAEMFLEGDRVLVVQSGWRYDEAAPSRRRNRMIDDFSVAEPVQGTTRVSVVDLSDPDDLTVTDAFRIDGAYQSARMIDGVARIVVASEPDGLDFLAPQSEEGEEAARDYNRSVVDESTIDDWLPSIRQDGEDARSTPCDEVYLPKRFAGAGMVNVLTVPVADRVEPETVSVQGSAQVVYASEQNLYVAAPSWVDPPEAGDDEVLADPPPTTTDVHRFSLTDPKVATYEVSGRVDGTVMGQFALSEQDDFLRVATTDGPQWSWDARSASNITVLHERDGQLVRRGKVGDMGRGEQITSVRFDGDRAYLVTYRQIDPFFVVDLSDPAHPEVAGELELPGFSSYLHPIGDDRVLGVGQDGTATGGVTGTKVSLFDVSDPAAPTEVARWTEPNGRSGAEEDHRAFLWWPETDQVVLPLDSPTFSGAVVLHVGRDAIGETGRVRQLGVERSLVAGEKLYTHSGFGLVSTNLADSGARANVSWT